MRRALFTWATAFAVGCAEVAAPPIPDAGAPSDSDAADAGSVPPDVAWDDAQDVVDLGSPRSLCEVDGGVAPVGTPCEEGRFCDGRGGCTLLQRSCPDPTELGCGVHALPAGRFEMGRGTQDGGIAPGAVARTTVVLSPFALDVYEVTRRRFRRWVAAGRPVPTEIVYRRGSIPFDRLASLNEEPGFWIEMSGGAPSVSDLEAVFANYWSAQAFCAWDGGRLPTEAEWEYAAVGVQDGRPYPRLYPWGDEDPSNDCALADWFPINRTAPGVPPMPPEACQGDRWFRPVGQMRAHGGLYDQAGGVDEWTADLFLEDRSACPGAPMSGSLIRVDPICINRGPLGAMVHGGQRGGSTTAVSLRSATRGIGRLPYGFRCARDPGELP